ncbi:MAG: adenine phosphoribosyltransferase [Spirochaetales bacterium]|nr:adenine phosphoribosyltransferase [Spirochaetales bacterium]
MDELFDLKKAIRTVQDFPKKGVLFYDITSILTNPKAFHYCLEKMRVLYAGAGFDAVAAVEARGFLFAAPFAFAENLPLILIRKKGKLPGKTLTKTFELEYGSDEIQVHKDDVNPESKVLLIDDLVATGGTVGAAAALLTGAGAREIEIFSVVGLPFLDYESELGAYTVTTLVNFHSE